tara:strand:- start:4186 stop:4794 length:609 start_codon:yes stop_codon:yes gene_type:complete
MHSIENLVWAMSLLSSMAKPSLSHGDLSVPCSYCGKDVDLKKRGLRKIPTNRNIYCNKVCMGKAQTERATITVECAYCKKSFQTLKGRHDETHQFCSQKCALNVRMDRYFWSICRELDLNDQWLSADMIRMKLKAKKVDLTAMRIATRITNNALVDVNTESEPYLYKLKEEYRGKPYTWHSNKFFRKISRKRSEYVAMCEKE